MRILVLQLKRIGDLILTTPALRALRNALPDAHIALAVAEGCAPLLGAIETVNTGIIFGPGRGFAPWQQVFTGGWDWCLDFTGNDRSAAATACSRSKSRATFAWVKSKGLRRLVYDRFVDSSVRERHTVNHYLDLLAPLLPVTSAPSPELRIPSSAQVAAEEMLRTAGIEGPFALLHPGTARPEKYWLPDRWARVAETLHTTHRLPTIITSGPAPSEQAHANLIQSLLTNHQSPLLLPPDLLTLAALTQRARLVISCDTATVHLAAAFETPQIALFGPTNPFHWRPRHARALVLSAAHPSAPLTDFSPKMKGAPMDGISTELVTGAMAQLLASP